MLCYPFLASLHVLFVCIAFTIPLQRQRFSEASMFVSFVFFNQILLCPQTVRNVRKFTDEDDVAEWF